MQLFQQNDNIMIEIILIYNQARDKVLTSSRKTKARHCLAETVRTVNTKAAEI